jgi:hypothetical protein
VRPKVSFVPLVLLFPVGPVGSDGSAGHRAIYQGHLRREEGEGRREKGEGRREEGGGRREKGGGRNEEGGERREEGHELERIASGLPWKAAEVNLSVRFSGWLPASLSRLSCQLIINSPEIEKCSAHTPHCRVPAGNGLTGLVPPFPLAQY